MGKLLSLKSMQEAVVVAFQNIGIDTTEQLLERGTTRGARKKLAEETGLSEREIQSWVHRADLLRIKGMGEEYSHLLQAAGIDTMKELSGLLPSSLFSKLVMLNREENYVRRMPSETMVANWVSLAKELSGKVS
jgi:hypothetical protein